MFGDNVTFSATVSVRVRDSDRVGGVHDRRHAAVPAVTLVNGVATTATSTLAAGSHTVHAAYSSDTGD